MLFQAFRYLIVTNIVHAFGLLIFLLTGPAYAADNAWKDHVVADKGTLSVDVSGVLVGELLREIGRKAKVKIPDDAISATRAKQRIAVSFSGPPKQGIALIVNPDFKVSSPGLLRITELNGQYSLQSNVVNLQKVMKELSSISGSDIKFLSPSDQNIKVKVFIENQPIQNVVGKVMDSLPFGGYASLGGANGMKQSFYVTSRKGADSFVNNAKTLLARIKNGEKPKPAEVKAWLLQVAAFGFPVDGPGTSLFIVPVLMLIDQNYPMYKEMSLSILQNADGSLPLRSAMLELAGRHWEDSDSHKSLEEVFQRPADNAVLQGMVSLTLAGHGENIGDLVVQRYPDVSPEAKFFYAQAISTLGRTDAVPLLLVDSQQTQNSALRDVAIGALIKLDPASAQTSDLVNQIIGSAKPVPIPERTVSDLDNERIAMHAIQAMAQSANFKTSQKLLLIASDESVAVDVRLTALESLTANAGAMSNSARSALYDRMAELSQRVTASEQLNEMNKERMFRGIGMLQKMTAPQ